jgi:predicted DNA binding CopG/RHH family protein
VKFAISKQIAIPLCSSQLTKISATTNRSGTNYLPFVRKIVAIARQTIQISIPLCSSQLTNISAPTNRSGMNYLPFVRKIVAIARQTIHLCIIHNRNANIKFKSLSTYLLRSVIYTFTIYTPFVLLYGIILYSFSFILFLLDSSLSFQLYSKLYIIICNNTSSPTKVIFTRPISCQFSTGTVGNRCAFDSHNIQRQSKKYNEKRGQVITPASSTQEWYKKELMIIASQEEKKRQKLKTMTILQTQDASINRKRLRLIKGSHLQEQSK